MEEKRRHKRLDIDVSVQLERLDEDGVTTLKYCHVDVTDISRSGIGFNAKVPLDIHTYYDTKIQIWTKEVVDAVVDIADEAGGIAVLASLLAFNGISIKNIGIINNREFEEGVLRIEFYDEDALESAISVLKERNYTIHRR